MFCILWNLGYSLWWTLETVNTSRLRLKKQNIRTVYDIGKTKLFHSSQTFLLNLLKNSLFHAIIEGQFLAKRSRLQSITGHHESLMKFLSYMSLRAKIKEDLIQMFLCLLQEDFNNVTHILNQMYCSNHFIIGCSLCPLKMPSWCPLEN